MAYYYYPYVFNFSNFLLFDLPLWILFFGLIHGILGLLKVTDPKLQLGEAAFSASAAYFIVKYFDFLFYWFWMHWSKIYGATVLVVFLAIIYIAIRRIV